MNRKIKDHTTKKYHYDTIDQYKKHLMAYLLVYNHQKPLKALKFKTPYDNLIELWNETPHLFRLNQNHKKVGLNKYAITVMLAAEKGILLVRIATPHKQKPKESGL